MNTTPILREGRYYHNRALIFLAIFAFCGCSQSYSKSSLVHKPSFVSKEQGMKLAYTPITVFPLRNSTGKPELNWISIGLQESLTTDLYYVSELHPKALVNFSRIIKGHCDEATLSCVTGYNAEDTTNYVLTLSDWQAMATDAKLGHFLWGEYQLQGNDIIVNLHLYGGEKFILQGGTIIKAPLAKLLQKASKQTLHFLESREIIVTPEERERILSPKTGSVTAWEHNAMGYWWRQKYFMSGDEQKKSIAENCEVVLKEAVTVDPNYAEAWCNFGYQKIVIGDLAGASKAFQKALERKPDLVNAHIGRGYCLTEKGDPINAISSLEQIIRLNPSLSDYYDYLMEAYRNARLWQEGLDSLDILENFLKERGRETERIEIVWWRAVFLQGLNDFSESEKTYREVLTFKETHLGPEDPEVAAILNDLAFLNKSRGEYNKAKLLYERTLTIDQKVNGYKHPDTARDLNNLGELYCAIGQYDKAKSLLEQALGIYEEVRGPDTLEVATVLNNLGLLYQAVSEYDKAKSFSERALAILEKIYTGGHPDIAKSLSNLAKLHYIQAQYEEAKPFYERALAIDKEVYGYKHPDVAKDLSNLAGLYYAQGEYAKAKLYYERALAINDEIYEGEHPDVAKDLNNLAELYRVLGKYDKAELLYARALVVSEKVNSPDHPSVALLLNNLAEFYCDIGEYNQARPLYGRALNIYQNVYGAKHPHVATVLNNLAGFYYFSNEYDQAKLFYARALEIDEEFFGNYHPQVSIRLNNLAEVYYAMGKYEEARPLYENALVIALASRQPELLWRVQFNLAYLLAKQEKPQVAIFFGKQAVNTLQKVRTDISKMEKELQKTFLKTKENDYRFLAGLLIDQGRIPEAQQVISMLKEEEFFDFLRRDAGKQDVRTTAATYTDEEHRWLERYQEINNRVAVLGREFAELRQKKRTGLTDDEKKRYQQLKEYIRISNRAFNIYVAKLINTLDSISKEPERTTLKMLVQLKQALRELGNGAVVIQYLITDEKLHIILTTPEVQIVHDVAISSKKLSRKIMDFRITLQNPRRSPLSHAQELYQVIFAPVAEDLRQAGAKTLMLSLNGVLRYLPMAALHDGENYVAEHYQLTIYNTAAKLVIKDRPTEKWRVGGLGLSKSVLNLTPLPNVPAELEGIVRRDDPLDKDGVLPGVIYLDESFTLEAVEAVLAEEYQVMHIASHFELMPGTIQNSRLVLGDGTTLSLAKIRDDGYDFGGVELLTLSACNTAVGGAGANGSEVESFGSLAQMHGAKGVLATLWPVIDQSTGIFMKNFYRLHKEQADMTKAKALQQAQMLFIHGGPGTGEKQGDTQRARKARIYRGKTFDEDDSFTLDPNSPYAHPYYWSPFILMGNWL